MNSAIYFITFSCFKNRNLLEKDRSKGIVINVLNSQLRKRQGLCYGFVVMPNHVHALIRLEEEGSLPEFMKQWKRLSSYYIKRLYKTQLQGYLSAIELEDPIWNRKYYSFPIESREKLIEKLSYMHNNPIKAGLVAESNDWAFSSVRYHELKKPVGVPITDP